MNAIELEAGEDSVEVGGEEEEEEEERRKLRREKKRKSNNRNHDQDSNTSTATTGSSLSRKFSDVAFLRRSFQNVVLTFLLVVTLLDKVVNIFNRNPSPEKNQMDAVSLILDIMGKKGSGGGGGGSGDTISSDQITEIIKRMNNSH